MTSNIFFNILTLNVRGIVNDNKRRKVLLWCENQGSDIVFLQETHCTKNKLNKFKDSWKGMSFYSLTDSPFSKGVGILFRENLPIRIINSKEYMNGRALLLNLEMHDHGFTVVCVYAPNDETARCVFFNNLTDWIIEHAKFVGSMILAGDLNCCMLDTDRNSRSHVKDKSRVALKEMISSFCLKDIGYIDDLHKKYTWTDGKIKSRLDYIFITKDSKLNLKQSCTKIVITDSIGQRVTDHRAVESKCYISVPCKGPNYWKFNCSLLQNTSFTSDMKVKLQSMCEELDKCDLSYFTKWEKFKRDIKQFTILYSTGICSI